MKQPPLTLCRLFSSTLILLFWVLLWNTSLTHKFRTRRTHKATAPAFHKCSFLKNLFIYFQREGKGGRKEGNKHQCEGETPVSCILHTPRLGPNQDMCLDWELNWWPFALQMTPNQLSYTSQCWWFFKINAVVPFSFSVVYLL